MSGFKFYEELSQVPIKWKGSAYLCPEGHQMHPVLFEYCVHCYKDAHCKGGCGWIDQSKFTLDDVPRKRTEGRKVIEVEVEDELIGE